MKKIHALLALTSLLAGGAAQAQSCPCNGGVGTLLTSGTATQSVLANRMVCASVGNERWQEWHNGGSSGPVVDYKRGPTDTRDPSGVVGTYAINADGSIAYTYGSSTYRYAVCQTGGTYTFCGAAFGGRDILGARVASSTGLQSCDNVAATATSNVKSPTRAPSKP